jgi:hypothetical protein
MAYLRGAGPHANVQFPDPPSRRHKFFEFKTLECESHWRSRDADGFTCREDDFVSLVRPMAFGMRGSKPSLTVRGDAYVPLLSW